jgi:tetratricopeptide (TPR) repeat protein
MKKVLLASLLACAATLSGALFASAQQPVNLGTGAQAPAPCALPDAEFTAYTNANNQTDPKAKAAAIEAYLTAFPQSACPTSRPDTLVVLMQTYAALNDLPKALDTADRVLQLDPNNLYALTFEAYLRKLGGDSATDPAAKQSAYDAAAGYAQKGLAATKPAATSDADFKTLQAKGFPIFYSTIGAVALNKKDTATAIDAFKKELAYVPIAQTQTPGPQLQDTYYLASAYLQSTPPDLLNCAFYAARFVAYAPEPLKTQFTPTAQYCYKKFHGDNTGYDAFAAAAQANLNPPDGLFAGVKPAPTPADIVANVIATTPDLGTLAVEDKEFILQNGTPDQAAKVWDTVKGKSVEIPDALVVASTPTQVQVAVTDGAKQTKTADFTFNLAPPEETKTAAAAAAAKKKADAVAAATVVGQSVTLDGTYDSFTPNPIMITMSGGDVVLPKAATKAPAKAPAHHTPAKKPAK